MKLLLVIAVVLSPVAALAERVALVIGNESYTHVGDLDNPGNDAKDIAKALSELGYEVSLHTDLPRAGMIGALREFRRKAFGAEHAIIYYAGHGVEMNRQNFLIPVDAELKSNLDVEWETVSLDDLMTAAADTTELSLVILDACRDNPFVAQMETTGGASRSIGRGLARVEPTDRNTLIAYAAKEGTVALDGDGRNSPFAAALLETLRTPGVDVRLVFGRVRDKVLSATRGQQQPFTYGSLSGNEIFLNRREPEPEPRPQVQPEASDARQALELAFWDTVKDSAYAADLQDYLDRFPDGAFASIAARRMACVDGSCLASPF